MLAFRPSILSPSIRRSPICPGRYLHVRLQSTNRSDVVNENRPETHVPIGLLSEGTVVYEGPYSKTFKYLKSVDGSCGSAGICVSNWSSPIRTPISQVVFAVFFRPLCRPVAIHLYLGIVASNFRKNLSRGHCYLGTIVSPHLYAL